MPERLQIAATRRTHRKMDTRATKKHGDGPASRMKCGALTLTVLTAFHSQLAEGLAILFSLSLPFFFTFFSLFRLVRFSRSAASLSAAVMFDTASFARTKANFLRTIIRRFLPARFRLVELLLCIAASPSERRAAGAVILMTLQGKAHPG